MRKTKILLWVLLTPVCLLLALVAYVMLINAFDVKPPDASDLVVERLNLEDADNAYTYFQKAADHTYWPTNSSATEIREDQALLATVAHSNHAAFVLLKQGVEYDVYQTAMPTTTSVLVPHIQPFLTLGRALVLKCSYELNIGQFDAAIESALVLTRFGWLMADGNSTLIEYLVGVAIYGMGLTRCEKLSQDDRMTVAQLRRLGHELGQYAGRGQALRRAFFGEYQFTLVATKELQTGNSCIEDFMNIKRHRVLSFIGRRVLHENRTAHLYSDFYRTMAKNSLLVYADMDLTDFTSLKSDRLSNIGLLLRPNPVGRILFVITVPSMESTLSHVCYTEMHASAVRVLVACHAYKRERGELPETLDQLVPAYLDAVPRDPYDGKPMRYSKSKAIIYAVGVDLVDSNGSIKPTNPKFEGLTREWHMHGEDIVFELYPK